MSKFNLSKTLLIAVFLSVFITSCKDDAVIKTPSKKTTVKYIVAFQENKVGEALEVDYVLELSSKENLTKGTFDVNGKGITQTSWRYFHQSANTLFTAGYSTDVTCNTYSINNEGEFAKKSTFTFDKTLNIFADTEDGKVIATELHFDGLDNLKFHIVDVSTGKVERIIETDFDFDKGNPGSIPWITGMVQQNGKVYASYYKLSAEGKQTSPKNDMAKIAIFSYPEMKLEKIITDSRTTEIGINGADTGLMKTENGDMYTYSSSSYSSGFTKSPNPSGVLRLKKGTSEFDKDYFFDVENATNGGKIFWMQYVGNGKAIARIILDDNKEIWSTFMGRDVLKMVVLDLNAKTVTNVKGVPNPQGQRYVSGSGILIEDGKVYTGITDSKETAVYIIDPETATGTKGAVATNARSLKGIFKLEK